jgi:hypothetical protein
VGRKAEVDFIEAGGKRLPDRDIGALIGEIELSNRRHQDRNKERRDQHENNQPIDWRCWPKPVWIVAKSQIEIVSAHEKALLDRSSRAVKIEMN